MPDNTLPAAVKDDFGPAMKALSPQRRAWVIAYCTNGGDATNAARDAGYLDSGSGSIKVQAYRLTHSKEVRAAIRETTIAMANANLPVYFKTLGEVATNMQHKDQVKALLALMDRGGMNVVAQSEHNINITVNKAQQIEEIKQMAEALGLNAQQLLGTVSDAEYEEIPKGLEEVW